MQAAEREREREKGEPPPEGGTDWSGLERIEERRGEEAK